MEKWLNHIQEKFGQENCKYTQLNFIDHENKFSKKYSSSK
jgi:hypothetical protein